MDPRSFLATVIGATSAATAGDSANKPVRLATVDPGYTGTDPPRVTFDGETALSSKHYAYLDSYRPTAGDRVVLAPAGTTYVIAGAISGDTSQPIRSTDILNNSVAATGGLVSTAGSVPRLTTTAADIPGAFWTFTTLRSNAVCSVTAVFDVESSNTTSTTIGELVVDGTAQTAQTLYRGTTRATVSQSWCVLLAAAGSHTLKLTGKLLVQADTVQVHPVHTTLTATVFDL